MATTWTLEQGQKRAREIERYGDTPAMYLAKIIECLRTGTFLPNDYGKTETTRYPLDDATKADYAEDVDGLKAWVVTAAELADAQERLHEQYPTI